MLKRLRPLFLTLTRHELETIWFSYTLAKGKPAGIAPKRTAEEWWDYYESQGVAHAELLAPTLLYVSSKDIAYKLSGVDL